MRNLFEIEQLNNDPFEKEITSIIEEVIQKHELVLFVQFVHVGSIQFHFITEISFFFFFGYLRVTDSIHYIHSRNTVEILIA